VNIYGISAFNSLRHPQVSEAERVIVSPRINKALCGDLKEVYQKRGNWQYSIVS